MQIKALLPWVATQYDGKKMLQNIWFKLQK